MKKTPLITLIFGLLLFSSNVSYASGLATVGIIGFLSNPYIASVFVILGIVSLIVEIMTPGFGLGALMSVVFFSLFFFASIATGVASILTLLVFVFGVMLLIVEVIVPGFGLPGIAGIVAMASSIAFALGSLEHAAITLFLAMIISFSLSYYLISKGMTSTWVEKVVHHNIFFPTMSDDPLFHVKIGDIGITTTILRPSGKSSIDGTEYNVVAEGGSYISKDSLVEVSAISGRTIYVKER